jgi:hypothetical protein
MSLCEIVKVRNVADAVGYPCTKASSHQCWGCGIAICEAHSETCSSCRQLFCTFCLSLHQTMHPKRAIAHSRNQERKTA